MMTLNEIDLALAAIPATPSTDADFDARSRLVAHRIDVEQAEKAAAHAASLPKVTGNLVVTIPAKLGVTDFVSVNGRVAKARMDSGRVVLDLFAPEFASLRAGPQGLLWERANADLMLTGQISSTIAA
jgi:hypothetical protein